MGLNDAYVYRLWTTWLQKSMYSVFTKTDLSLCFWNPRVVLSNVERWDRLSHDYYLTRPVPNYIKRKKVWNLWSGCIGLRRDARRASVDRNILRGCESCSFRPCRATFFGHRWSRPTIYSTVTWTCLWKRFSMHQLWTTFVGTIAKCVQEAARQLMGDHFPRPCQSPCKII